MPRNLDGLASHPHGYKTRTHEVAHAMSYEPEDGPMYIGGGAVVLILIIIVIVLLLRR